MHNNLKREWTQLTDFLNSKVGTIGTLEISLMKIHLLFIKAPCSSTSKAKTTFYPFKMKTFWIRNNAKHLHMLNLNRSRCRRNLLLNLRLRMRFFRTSLGVENREMRLHKSLMNPRSHQKVTQLINEEEEQEGEEQFINPRSLTQQRIFYLLSEALSSTTWRNTSPNKPSQEWRLFTE